MKKILLLLLAIVGAGLLALGLSFTASPLPVGEPLKVEIPAANPPPGMSIAVLHAGKMLSQAAFAYRGGSLTEQRIFGMAGVLVRHPQGDLLFDAGFGSRVDVFLPPGTEILVQPGIVTRAGETVLARFV